jgi:hypothetical protein
MLKTPPLGFEHLRRTMLSRFCAASRVCNMTGNWAVFAVRPVSVRLYIIMAGQSQDALSHTNLAKAFMNQRCVADVEGRWIDPDFDSGLIQRCRRYWNVPVAELPNEALATYLRQRIALSIIIPEAEKRIASGFDDDSELYDGELADALRSVQGK